MSQVLVEFVLSLRHAIPIYVKLSSPSSLDRYLATWLNFMWSANGSIGYQLVVLAWLLLASSRASSGGWVAGVLAGSGELGELHGCSCIAMRQIRATQ
jgi:hypothetical protein